MNTFDIIGADPDEGWLAPLSVPVDPTIRRKTDGAWGKERRDTRLPITVGGCPAKTHAHPAKKRQRKAQRKARKVNRGRK